MAISDRALTSLFDRRARDIYRYCASRSEPSAAEDLLSTVFLEAWRSRRSAILVGDTYDAWLFGIARNVCRHRWRAQRRHRAALERFGVQQEQEDVPDLADAVAARIDAGRAVELLETAKTHLTAHYRAVVQLCLEDGLPTQTVAEMLGIPHGTVKSRLAHARRALGLMLSGEPSSGDRPVSVQRS